MDYEIVIVGGGLGGSSLAGCMAREGRRVLVLERETRFIDRVRGEQMHPWGVAAARALGIYEPLLQTCGHQTRLWSVHAGGQPMPPRDLSATTPHAVGSFHFYHPAMQETLLQRAERLGAEVRRGATVESILCGDAPSVEFRQNGGSHRVTATLVVGADGRASTVRHRAGFEVRRDPENLMVAGTLLEDSGVPDDGVYMAMGAGTMMLMAPLGQQRVRTYFIYPKATGLRPLSGNAHADDFLRACRSTGAPEAWLSAVRVSGPLAQFSGADRWVEHPAREGVVLIGDAAAASDPSWGSGLSLTLLDVWTLSRCLTETGDCRTAIRRYAEEHDRYYGALHAVEAWFANLFWTPGSAGEARRADLMPRLRAPGMPDIVGLGPESPVDETGRRLWAWADAPSA